MNAWSGFYHKKQLWTELLDHAIKLSMLDCVKLIQVYGRSAPWLIRPGSIRPTFLVDLPRRIWDAEGPGKWGGSSTEVYAVVPPHSNESTEWVDLWKKSHGFRHHYSLTQAMPTVDPRPTTRSRWIFELGLTHSHTVASCHWSRLTEFKRYGNSYTSINCW